MSAPGSNRKKYEDGRRKQSADTVNFTVDASGWSVEEHRRAAQYQSNFNQPFPLANYDLTAAPTGPLDIRMGSFGTVPEPRSPNRHHKSGPHFAAPGPYDGSGAVKRTPTHMTSQRINDFPQELGGRRGYPEAPPKPSQRPHDYTQPSYQTAAYPAAAYPGPAVPRSPDGITGHRISMSINNRLSLLIRKPLAQDPTRIHDTPPMAADSSRIVTDANVIG
ncbi:hypothetical protein B0H13DRAFT_2315577 [Mycena leptocephala]|nr:hypothetical protein B0H13DRAFT_2315577 [Mycena leptocephala]